MSQNGELQKNLYQKDIRVTTSGLHRQFDGTEKLPFVVMLRNLEKRYWVNTEKKQSQTSGEEDLYRLYVMNIKRKSTMGHAKTAHHGKPTLQFFS